MRLKYMHKVRTVVEDLRSKHQSQTWAVFQLRFVGWARLCQLYRTIVSSVLYKRINIVISTSCVLLFNKTYMRESIFQLPAPTDILDTLLQET
jgi:hypothetical protein